jgi:hypothetical protein
MMKKSDSNRPGSRPPTDPALGWWTATCRITINHTLCGSKLTADAQASPYLGSPVATGRISQ